MNPRAVKVFVIAVGLAGLAALVTGVGSFEYSFKTGHWSRLEGENPTAARIVGAVLVGMGIFLFRLKPSGKYNRTLASDFRTAEGLSALKLYKTVLRYKGELDV